MKLQALFSSKNRRKNLRCSLLQILFGALTRVKVSFERSEKRGIDLAMLGLVV